MKNLSLLVLISDIVSFTRRIVFKEMSSIKLLIEKEERISFQVLNLKQTGVYDVLQMSICILYSPLLINQGRNKLLKE